MTAQYGKGDRGKATKLHSVIVRARGACERCGESDYSKLQAAHIVRRSAAHTRTDTANAWCLCASCHFTVDGDQWEFVELVNKTIGQEFWRLLRQKAHDGVRVKFDWSVERARLQAIWDAIQEQAA